MVASDSGKPGPTLQDAQAAPPKGQLLETSIARSKTMKPGGEHYRAFVGPPEQYDFMGATQFRLLTSLGLREEHYVVDIGCGSLRAGKFLLQYLMPDRYVGIEPNEWLWKEAIKAEIGQDTLAIKRPKFFVSPEFDLPEITRNTADFMIAQSIYSHTGHDAFFASLQAAAQCLKPTGQFLFTVVAEGCLGFPRMKQGADASGWIYPACVSFPSDVVKTICSQSGLHVQPLAWFHPRQRWFRAVLDEALLLDDDMVSILGTGRPLFDDRF